MTIARWHALEVRRGKEASAAVFIAMQWPNTEVMFPLDVKTKITPTIAEVKSFLRMPPYIFAKFPSSEAGALTGEAARDAGIISVVPSATHPQAVPDKVIAALRAWRPQPKDTQALHLHRPGDVITVYLVPGKPQQAVLTAYDRGRGRARVRIWILGAEREMPVPVTALESQETQQKRARG